MKKMKKNILSLLLIALTTVLFTSCEKEDEAVALVENCKTCGTFITFDDTLTDEEIAILQEEDDFVDDTQEYCGDELSAYEAELSENGGSITMDYGIYTVTLECQ